MHMYECRVITCIHIIYLYIWKGKGKRQAKDEMNDILVKMLLAENKKEWSMYFVNSFNCTASCKFSSNKSKKRNSEESLLGAVWNNEKVCNKCYI